MNTDQKKEIQMQTGVEFIAEERRRQIELEGWNYEHDNGHKDGELAMAGAAYAVSAARNQLTPPPLSLWPWSRSEFNPKEDPIRDLARAGALIAAEIDRLQRDKFYTQLETALAAGSVVELAMINQHGGVEQWDRVTTINRCFHPDRFRLI